MFERLRRHRGSSRRTVDRDGREYTIRQYRDRDRNEVLALYRAVLESGLSEAWFEWKYESNPYVEDVPVYVAEHDGTVVGAGGFWVLELHTGSRSTRVVQPCDAAVRPAHRRRGLYTEILGRGLERFDDDGLDIAFDFPNELSKATFEKYGWRPVERRETFFRLQRPGALLGDRFDGPAASLAADGARLLARGYLAAASRRRSAASDRLAIDVERTAGIPAETLAALYRRAVPDAFHVVRDETFYEWRFENPQWTYTTYVGRYEGTPIAAIVTGTTVENGAVVTHLTDIVPLVADRSRTAAFGPLLEAVLEASDDAALVVAPSTPIPRAILSAYGFRSDHSLPLSLAATPTVHGVCTLSDGDDRDRWLVDGKRLPDPDAWRITFSEYDTG
ncbi:GNAT family N-acetyltransferase [Halopiger djelfimassiliensis]|uniref:GNAT family N-acetyltransferase n=1 Tax=Halopiger djelfimassiliensis TaxID=1293047 RepID=UPI0006780110|nr:GNAT family N-acetyltransferase [Halopiger djelfimassiliensis]